MSIALIAKVFKEDMPPTQKFILIALADNANDEGLCYPFISGIENKTGYSKKTIISNINKLEEAGYLQKRIRARKKGGRYSNIYLLYPSENYENLDEKYQEYFSKNIENSAILEGSQSVPVTPISEDSQSVPATPKFGSQSVPATPKLTIVEPSLIIEPSLNEEIYTYYKEHIKTSLSKQQSLNNIKRWLKDFSKEDLLKAIDNYMPTVKQQENKKYIKDCKNFFGVSRGSEGFFKDFIIAQEIEPTMPNGQPIPSYML